MRQARTSNPYITGKSIHRFITLLFVVLISATSGFLLHANAMDSNDKAGEQVSYVEPVDQDYKILCVEPGDTLWSIAKAYGDPDRDVRSYIRDIREFNQLESSELQAGQLLKLP
jgi:hypothetical protein